MRATNPSGSRATIRAAVFAVGLLLGCGGEEPAAEQAPEAITAEEEAAAPGELSRGGSRQVVEVLLGDDGIAMEGTLPTGRVRFSIRNGGSRPHGFVLESERATLSLEEEVEAGGTAFLDADVLPGTYQVFCPVRGHPRGLPQLLVATDRAARR